MRICVQVNFLFCFSGPQRKKKKTDDSSAAVADAVLQLAQSIGRDDTPPPPSPPPPQQPNLLDGMVAMVRGYLDAMRDRARNRVALEVVTFAYEKYQENIDREE